ncbi:hypothetical protein BLNAU_3066 [Blattamonas nauphoetae]|uniref:Uncharacterized protein n=1 Tax=Blattamonas nauphoetae TaxID=2049346 RepID=A0ABQ9YE75_9EUKA|nr:hypothetical protein BLNAU_3066 [Blattamonas nauphoetae]
MVFGKKSEGEENTCGGLGADVFLLFTNSVDISTISDWSEFLFSSSPADGIAFARDERLSAAFGVNETEVVLLHSILAEVHPFDDETMFVDGQNGLDESKCGLSTIPCATLSRGMEGVSDEGKIAIRTEAEITELMTLDKSVVWVSAGGDRARVVLAEAGSVSVKSHSLALVGLAFSAQPSSSTRARSVVTLQSGALTVHSCTFEGIHSSSSGSCIKATLDSTASLTITETDFTTCTSTADGGTFSTSGTITFEGCSATGNGQFLSLSSADLVTLLKVGTLDSIKPSLPNNNDLFSSTQKEQFFGFESPSSSGSLLYYWYPHMTSETSTHIHSSGEDHPLCGVKSLPCQSISTALNHPNSENTFSIDSALTLSETITVTQTAMLTSSSSRAITVSSDGIIIVTANELTLSNLAFTGLGSSTSQSFVTVSLTGSLTVSSCYFSSFSSLTNGGALNVALTTGSLSITGTTFKKCSSSLNGGAIFVDLTSLSSPGSYSLSSVIFGTAAGDLNSCGQNGKGSDLFISVASGQTSLISSASLTGSYFTTPSGGSSSTFTSSEMSKYEFSEIDGSSGSIMYLIHHYTGGQLFVNSESAAVNSLCGHKHLACQTLPLGHSSSKDSSDGKEASVFLSTNVTLSDAFSSSKTVKWTSDRPSTKPAGDSQLKKREAMRSGGKTIKT